MLKVGDRVEHVLIMRATRGTVERIDKDCVQVQWDDGTIGDLYFSKNMVPNVRYLQKLCKGNKNN